MEDHIWLQKIDELFEDKRYILWLTPDTSTGGGSVIERSIQQLKDQFSNQMESQEQKVLRAIGLLSEDVANLKSTVEEAAKKSESLALKNKPKNENSDDDSDEESSEEF